jgi:magnesium transporter
MVRSGTDNEPHHNFVALYTTSITLQVRQWFQFPRTLSYQEDGRISTGSPQNRLLVLGFTMPRGYLFNPSFAESAIEEPSMSGRDRLENLRRQLDSSSPEDRVAILEDAEPADVAELLAEMPEAERDQIFDQLGLDARAEVLSEMEDEVEEEIISHLDAEVIADIAEHMAPDDSADFIGDLEPEQKDKVLAAMEPEERVEVKQLLSYEEDTAGAIMTTEMLVLPSTTTVREVREALVAQDFTDPVFYVFVVQPDSRKLVGLVTLEALFSTAPTTSLDSLTDRSFIAADPQDDQELVAHQFGKYDLWVMPVVDGDGNLLGRITADDILEVMQDEADEDLARFAGAPDIDDDETSPARIVSARLPWLLITMFAGLLNSVIIKKMLDVTNVVAIAIFIPAILAMGGNTGIQSSTVSVRGLALGHTRYRRVRGLISREITVGLSLGVICGLITGLVVWGFLSYSTADTGGLSARALGATVGASMANAMLFASCFGAVAPVVLDRFSIDPAHAAGPFITTFNDLSASVIYFISCVIMLQMM